MRFGFTDGQPKTLDEIGKVYSVTRERVATQRVPLQRIMLRAQHNTLQRDATARSMLRRSRARAAAALAARSVCKNRHCDTHTHARARAHTAQSARRTSHRCATHRCATRRHVTASWGRTALWAPQRLIEELSSHLEHLKHELQHARQVGALSRALRCGAPGCAATYSSLQRVVPRCNRLYGVAPRGAVLQQC
jgi:hypothetical protein